MKINKVLITIEELNVLSKTFPNMTVLEFLELKKRG